MEATTTQAIALTDTVRGTIYEGDEDTIEYMDAISDLLDIARRMNIGNYWRPDQEWLDRICDHYCITDDMGTAHQVARLAWSLAMAAGAQPTNDQLALAERLGLWSE